MFKLKIPQFLIITEFLILVFDLTVTLLINSELVIFTLFSSAGIKDVIVTTGYKFSSLITSIIENRHNDQVYYYN